MAPTARGWMTVELGERTDGTWVATGVDGDVVGEGPGAAAAAADYYRQLAREG